jgi:hypothetical protein
MLSHQLESLQSILGFSCWLRRWLALSPDTLWRHRLHQRSLPKGLSYHGRRMSYYNTFPTQQYVRSHPSMLCLTLTLTRTDQLSEQICHVTQESRCLIEGAEATLREKRAMYEMKYMECSLCTRRHPLSARKCHPCSNTNLRQMYCTCELRVSDYMEILRRVGLWGSSAPIESLAGSEIQYRMSCARNDVKHSCDAGPNCPLKIQLKVVADSLQRLLDDCRGLDLEDSIANV